MELTREPLDDLSQRIEQLSPEQKLLLQVQLGKQRGVPEPIAIVGIGCRFPGANHVHSYWQLLQDGKDAVREIPADRWSLPEFYDSDPSQPGKHYCRQGGFLDQIDQFEPEFFGIAPREAVYIDPQQRLLLEVLWEALEDAALPPAQLSGTKTGVFVGASTLDYGQLLLQRADRIAPYTTTGLASTMLANRVSYLLNLQGPSLTVDTACSSSLVAVHLACQSLWQGESTLALAGGVNVMLTPSLTIGFSKLTALSPDGRCKAFDAAANGFVRSEGVGVVVLKPLSKALAQGDRIYALIRGGAINQDGRTNGLTAPNREAQERVLLEAYRQARVPLHQVSYIEAHGTGTLLGDPIEAKALGQVFSPSHPLDQPIRIGSVKSNIGHTEAAAGIASLIKVALALKHQQLVPSLHFETPNPYIPFDQLPLRVQTERQPWEGCSEHTIAGVSSFGFGGTNAHIVLQAPPQLSLAVPEMERPCHLLTLSARSETALRALARQYLPLLQASPASALGDLCFTANTGRTNFNYRLVATAATTADLHQSLTEFVAGQASGGPWQTALPGASDAPAVVWLFTGQGSQYPGMGQQLYKTQPVFRATLDRCDEILKPYLDAPLLEVLYPSSPADERLHQTAYTQPALFAVEYALAELWQSWGVRPAAVLGHSIGEYVAACVAGVFSLEDGLKLMAQRGRLMQSLPEIGMMAAVLADTDTVAKLIAPYPETVAIATLNGPKNTVISGLRQDVKTILEACQQQQIPVTPLTVSHAFHSPLMEPILNLFEHGARQISLQPPRIPMVANLTGTFLAPGEIPDARYWRRHAREAVRFAEGLATLHARGYTHFLEIGPQPVLSRLGQQCLPQLNGQWLPSLRRRRPDWSMLSASLSQLYLEGVTIDWRGFDQPYGRQKRSLPTYPFQRQRYWIDLPSVPEPAAVPSTPATEAYVLRWQPQAAAMAQRPVQSGRWLIWAEADDVWQCIAPAVQAQGGVPLRVTLGANFAQLQPDHYQIAAGSDRPCQALFSTLAQQDIPTPTQILYFSPDSDPDLEWLEQPLSPLLSLLQELAAQPTASERTKLWLVSQGIQAVTPQDVVTNLSQAMLWGLGRTLRLEHPEFWGGLVDWFRANTDPALAAQTLVAHILAADGEDEAAIRQGQRWVPRLQPLSLPSVPEQTPLQASATYLITGGTGALGQQLTQWLVTRGARHLVLLSRRGSHPDLETALAPLRSQGAEIWVEAVDVADADALARLLTRVQQQLPPLKGIFHAAGVLADGFLINQTPEQFHRVMPAKLQGAWNLHQLTQTLELDWFVLFSSIAALLGSPGQSNYSAANAGLDALAHYRQQQGLAALSIGWGPWQEAGMAVDQQPAAAAWSQRGMPPLAVDAGLQWLTTLLDQPLTAPHVGIAGIDWPRLQRYLPLVPPVLADVAGVVHPSESQEEPQPTVEASSDLLQRLLWLDESDRVTELVAYFQTQVAQVMGLNGPVPLDRPLLDLGIDSLMTMDLLALCRQDLQLVLYPREIMAHPTVADLAQYVASELVRLHQPQTASTSSEHAAAPEPLGGKLPSHPWQAVAPLDPLPSQPNDSMIFLLSAPRSGSTLLRVMLAGHPDLFCPPELHLLPFNTLAAQQTALGGSYLQEGLQRALMELWQIDADRAEALLSDWSQHQLTVPEVYAKLQQTAAPRQLVDKSPTYSFGLETLERAEQIFAGAKYIHLVRHPYAVIDSFVRNRMHKIFDMTPADPYQLAEQVWQTSNHNIATFLNRIDPTRHHLLRYEDLVADPAPAMEALCTFLDLSFDPAVLTPYQGRRMTDGIRAKSLAVDDPNFRQRDQIDPRLATVWQSIQLPRRLNLNSRTLAQRFNYPLPQEVGQQTEASERPVVPTPLPPSYVPLARLRQEHITLRGRDSCICHWGPEQGVKVLCIHGILEHGAAWDAVADTLAQQGYHVIAPDLRGHGHSAHAGPDGSYQLVDFLGDIDQFTQILTAESSPVVLVGHSLGAVLSAVLTSLRPERFSRLVLVEPVVPAAAQIEDTAAQLAAHLDYLATPPDPVVLSSLTAAAQRLQALKPSLTAGAAQKLVERLTRPVPGGLAWRRDPRLQTRTALSLGGGLVDRHGYGQLLRHIALPTTVVFGHNSQFNRPEDLAFLRDNLSLAVSLTLPGGHDLPTETSVDLANIIHRAIQQEHP